MYDSIRPVSGTVDDRMAAIAAEQRARAERVRRCRNCDDTLKPGDSWQLCEDCADEDELDIEQRQDERDAEMREDSKRDER